MGSSEDALYFQTRYNGLSVGRCKRYPCDLLNEHAQAALQYLLKSAEVLGS